MPAGSFGIRPNGKKLSAQVAGASLVEADVADVFGIGAADIKVLLEKTLRRIGVRVHNRGRVVDGASARAYGLGEGKRRA